MNPKLTSDWDPSHWPMKGPRPKSGGHHPKSICTVLRDVGRIFLIF